MTNSTETTIRKPRTSELGHGPVYEMRMSANMSRPQFAEATGISLNTIKRCETDGTWPRNPALEELLVSKANQYQWVGANIIY